MDKYTNSYSFVKIRKKDIPKGERIYRMLWAYRLKSKPTEKDKVNPSKLKADVEPAPRLCFVGTGMDPSVYQTFADVARDQTVSVMGAILAAHIDDLDDWQADDSDAFQNTITDGSDGDKATPAVYSYPAPGFEEYDEDGNIMCYEHRTAFQGRRDAPRLYGEKAKAIITKCDFKPLLYDPEAYQYLHGPSSGTADSLTEIIEKLRGVEQPPPGHKPLGWAMMCRHVDDRLGLETKSSNKRVAEYLSTAINNVFATSLTNWKRVLGWDAVINKEDRTVTFESMPSIIRAKDTYLASQLMTNAKHVMMPSIMQLEPGVAPPLNHPDHADFVAMQTRVRALIGMLLWWSKKYPKIQFATTKCGQFAHNPSHGVERAAMLILMHLWCHPYACHWGGEKCRSLELATPIKQPHNYDDVMYGLYYMIDANLGDDVVS